MVHVALIAAHAPPQVRPQAILLGKLLRHLPRGDLDVSLLTAATLDEMSGISTYRYQRRSRIIAAAVARMWPANFWRQTRVMHARAFRSARRMLADRHVDVFMGFAKPYAVNVLGAQLSERYGLPFIAHYSDPFVDDPYQALPPIIRNGRLEVERRVLQQADAVVFVNERLKEWVLDRHPPGLVHHAVVIPHSFEKSLYPEVVPIREGPEILMRHIGALYGPRNGRTFLDALEMLRRENPGTFSRIKAEFIGPDLYETTVPFEAEVRRRGLTDSVVIRPIIAYSESLAEMVHADVLVNIDAEEGAPIFLMSKLIDYLGAGSPILCLTQPGSPSGSVCRLAGALVADVRDPEDIAAAILRLIAETGAQQHDQAYVAQFAIEQISQVWVELFRDIARGQCR